MPTTIDDNPVMRKTKELCQTILDLPDLQSARQRIEKFMGDEASRSQYDDLVAKGNALQQKQQMSTPLTGEEIAEFEQHRDAVLANPVSRSFLEAQEQIHQIQQAVHHYVSKTLELGRMPTQEDLNSSCGHGGCGCGH